MPYVLLSPHFRCLRLNFTKSLQNISMAYIMNERRHFFLIFNGNLNNLRIIICYSSLLLFNLLFFY
jgi:hypothetical protein